MATEATAGSLDTVKDADGKAWPATKTAANKADGSVDFGEMSFSAAGTYKVTIKEVKGDAAHDADGKAWPATKTAANKADGSVDFGEMSFSAAGTYKVTIKEVKGDAAHMTYEGDHQGGQGRRCPYDLRCP